MESPTIMRINSRVLAQYCRGFPSQKSYVSPYRAGKPRPYENLCLPFHPINTITRIKFLETSIDALSIGVL